jgi:hypothetical protein
MNDLSILARAFVLAFVLEATAQAHSPDPLTIGMTGNSPLFGGNPWATSAS